VSEDERARMPDSLVLRTTEGRLLVKSVAVREGLRRIGGPAKLLAAIAGLVPTRLADRLYDAVARVRARFFEAPADACPAVSPGLRERLLP
jgi:predicted DCC family thiol-disulfide oxidoreductase YuxK